MKIRKRKRRGCLRRLLSLGLLLVAVWAVFTYWPFGFPDEGLVVRYYDVGQSDAILVKCGDRTMLIDAGTNEGQWWLLARLWLDGIRRLDVAVATHPHADHIGGLDVILQFIKTDTLLLPDVAHTTQTFSDLIKSAKRTKTNVMTPTWNTSFQMNEAIVRVLGPIGLSFDSLNNYSLVMRLDYMDTSFLFTGDAEIKSEEILLQESVPLDVDVLKVGHHGSKSSTSSAFLDAVTPQYAVISVGSGNEYGHPVSTVLSALNGTGAKVLRTDQLGTVTFTVNNGALQYDTSRSILTNWFE